MKQPRTLKLFIPRAVIEATFAKKRINKMNNILYNTYDSYDSSDEDSNHYSTDYYSANDNSTEYDNSDNSSDVSTEEIPLFIIEPDPYPNSTYCPPPNFTWSFNPYHVELHGSDPLFIS